MIRQQGGGVVTCAGAQAYLIPATGYARARFDSLYGNSQRGYRSGTAPEIKFVPDHDAYRQLIKTTRCDSQGNFAFENVAEGDFYVMTVVSWTAGYSSQGGWLMQLVSTRGGTSPTVVLSP